MNLSQRQNEILRILKEKKYLSVEELSSALSVSKVTIRSDLTALEEKGAVTRTHGGVMIAEVAPRIVSNSLTEHEAEKKSIGKTAAALIPDDLVKGNHIDSTQYLGNQDHDIGYECPLDKCIFPHFSPYSAGSGKISLPMHAEFITPSTPA